MKLSIKALSVLLVPKEGNGFMTTKQKYRNFELKFEVKLDLGLNSGCQIRSMPLQKELT